MHCRSESLGVTSFRTWTLNSLKCFWNCFFFSFQKETVSHTWLCVNGESKAAVLSRKTCTKQQKRCLKSPVGVTVRLETALNRRFGHRETPLVAAKLVTMTPAFIMKWTELKDQTTSSSGLLGVSEGDSKTLATIQRLRWESVFAELPGRLFASDPGRVFAPLLQLAAHREAHFLPLFYFVLSPATGDNFYFISRLLPVSYPQLFLWHP